MRGHKVRTENDLVDTTPPLITYIFCLHSIDDDLVCNKDTSLAPNVPSLMQEWQEVWYEDFRSS